MRSRTFSIWTAGGHVLVNWLNCTQAGQMRTMTQRLDLERLNGSDVLELPIVSLMSKDLGS